jgi:hypothetical protein
MDSSIRISIKKGLKRFIFLLIGLMIISSLACSLPFEIVWKSSSEENEKTAQANTAIAELLVTKEPSTADDVSSDDDLSDEQAEENPSETPSATPEPTSTDTPVPENTRAEVLKNTNCRTGPKDIFDLIQIFSAGDMVDLLGENEEGTFWYVRDRENSEIECWVWKEYVSARGDTAYLPVFTPPPEPAPILNFAVSYKNTSGETTVTVYVRNTGNVPLQSYTATFKDTDTSETIVVSGNKFGNAAKVSVGNTGVISSSPFSASTIGHYLNVTVKACSEDGQGGKCYSGSTSFESK